MLRPIDVPILDAKHLTLAAAGFQRADDAIVHRWPRPLVFAAIHRQARLKKGLLLVAMNPAIALRFVADLDVHAKAVKWARRQQRRILESAPIYRGSQDT